MGVRIVDIQRGEQNRKLTSYDVPIGSGFRVLTGELAGQVLYRTSNGFFSLTEFGRSWSLNWPPGEVDILPAGTRVVVELT